MSLAESFKEEVFLPKSMGMELCSRVSLEEDISGTNSSGILNTHNYIHTISEQIAGVPNAHPNHVLI